MFMIRSLILSVLLRHGLGVSLVTERSSLPTLINCFAWTEVAKLIPLTLIILKSIEKRVVGYLLLYVLT